MLRQPIFSCRSLLDILLGQKMWKIFFSGCTASTCRWNAVQRMHHKLCLDVFLGSIAFTDETAKVRSKLLYGHEDFSIYSSGYRRNRVIGVVTTQLFYDLVHCAHLSPDCSLFIFTRCFSLILAGTR